MKLTKMTSEIKERLKKTIYRNDVDKYAHLDDEIQSDKWKNLHFAKCGKSTLSVNTYKSAAEALKANKGVFNRFKVVPILRIGLEGISMTTIPALIGQRRSDGTKILEYSHAIQIPVKD